MRRQRVTIHGRVCNALRFEHCKRPFFVSYVLIFLQYVEAERQIVEAEYLCQGAYSASVAIEPGSQTLLTTQPLVYSNASVAPSSAAVPLYVFSNVSDHMFLRLNHILLP